MNPNETASSPIKIGGPLKMCDSWCNSIDEHTHFTLEDELDSVVIQDYLVKPFIAKYV